MSNNPFGDNDPAKDPAGESNNAPNPYQSPRAESDWHGAPPTEALNPNLLGIPAAFLLALAILTLVILLMSVPIQWVRISQMDLSRPEGVGAMVGMVGTLGTWLIITITIIVGSVGMLCRRGYGVAFTASVLAMIPLCSPCYILGIPFGLWAFFLLRQNNVRASFKS